MLVLFTHGSRDPRWLEPFERLEASLAERLGPGRVRLAHMEVSPPTLMDVAAEAASRGVELIRLLPLFMAGGGHVATDVPAQAREAEGRFPGLKVEVLPAVGEHPKLLDVVEELALEAARGGPA